MILEQTRMVTPERGPRPAGKPTECSYCRRPIGEPHNKDCVMVEKVVMVEVKLTIPRVVPAHWDAHDIEFHMNDSSWCGDNIVNELEKVVAAREGKCKCLCSDLEATFLRDATTEDMERTDAAILAGLRICPGR